MARRQVGAIPCAHPAGLIVRPSPQHRGPRSASTTAILASLEARSNKLLRSPTRAGCAPIGAPRTRRADDGKVRRMAHRKCASSPQAHGCAFGEPRRPLANPEHRMCEGRVRGVAFLWATFLWPRKERWLARPGGGRKKTGTPRDGVASAFPIRPLGTFPRMRGKETQASEQHDIELLLPVLLLGLEADRLPDEGFQLGDGR